VKNSVKKTVKRGVNPKRERALKARILTLFFTSFFTLVFTSFFTRSVREEQREENREKGLLFSAPLRLCGYFCGFKRFASASTSFSHC
jgi:hypothetical protein